VAPTDCPSCGSSFLQPLRCEAKGDEAVLVELRCAECGDWLSEPFTRAEVRELDQHQAALRQELLEAYERSVAESMIALASLFGAALALDLIGADDFAPRSAARRYAPAASPRRPG
jgi:predicted amidophosphoribosyltransferase